MTGKTWPRCAKSRRRNRVRVDANEGWATKEEALRSLEWLAADGNIQSRRAADARVNGSARPKLVAGAFAAAAVRLDELYHHAKDVALCSECFHG